MSLAHRFRAGHQSADAAVTISVFSNIALHPIGPNEKRYSS